MSKKLLIWDQNYADEFDIFGFELVDSEVVDLAIRVIENAEDEDPIAGECDFGTNESIDLDSDSVLDALKNAKELTEEELEVITRCLGKGQGHTFFDRVCSRLLDYDSEFEEEDRPLTDSEAELLNKYSW